jgi:hypothetical protein
MKFVSKYLLAIFGAAVVLPIIITLVLGCYTQGKYGLPGWGCSKSLFYIINAIPLVGSIAVILLNILTKKLRSYLCIRGHFPYNCDYFCFAYISSYAKQFYPLNSDQGVADPQSAVIHNARTGGWGKHYTLMLNR